MRKFECFKQLEVWRKARCIRKQIYQITKTFPGFEQYALSMQMKRTAVSITANIAEGFGRQSWAENMRFCRISRGSAFELRDHLTTAYDERYISGNVCDELDRDLISVVQMLNGYIRSMTRREASRVPKGRSRR